MIFQQLFDKVSSTYTYILIEKVGGVAVIIDPVFENIDTYIALFKKLNVKLINAIDTHTHADHISGLGMLRDITHCATLMGEQSKAHLVAIRVKDGDKITWKGNIISAIYTPGHTDDSYSFLIENHLFTGDALLIGGTGRTDFQNGDPYIAYDSLFNKLLKLPDDTLIFPAHDYNGNYVSTIGYEKLYNPRLQVKSPKEYAEIMNNLHLPNPKMMDIAVPANVSLGMDDTKFISSEENIEATKLMREKQNVLIDIREEFECLRDGIIPGSIQIPYSTLDDALKTNGVLRQYLNTNKENLSQVVIVCAFGDRSAMAVDRIRRAGYAGIRHLKGGLSAWIKNGGIVIKN